MENIISFSLYGNLPKYCEGAIKNVLLHKVYFPDWICRVYYNSSVPKEYLERLKEVGAQVIDMSESNINEYGMFWRFLPYDDKNVLRFLVRDTDSRLSMREKYAVDDWIKSDKSLHIMRDHPYHNVKILGGTWGLKNDFRINMKLLIEKHLQDNKGFRYNDDQLFLNRIYDIYAGDILAHDDFFHYRENKPFPHKREGLKFIGEVYDEYDNSIFEHTKILNAALIQQKNEKRPINIIKTYIIKKLNSLFGR